MRHDELYVFTTTSPQKYGDLYLDKACSMPYWFET